MSGFLRQLHGRRLSTVTVGGAAAVRGCARHGDPQSVGGDSSRVGCELRRPQLLHRCLCVCAKVISGVSMCVSLFILLIDFSEQGLQRGYIYNKEVTCFGIIYMTALLYPNYNQFSPCLDT